MSGSGIKKLRRAKIKQQLKEQREAKLVDDEAKVVADAIANMKDMTEEDWDKLAEELANELGVDNVEIKDKEE